jgi:hypothetical protein
MLKKQDWPTLLALAGLFVVMLVVTWQRWTHPIIDHGREMNVPLRLLAGERLYVDILYYYGPLAPYFNALLYSVFGVHLRVLHASGMAFAVFSLLLIYWLARRLLSPWEATLATALVLVTCALAAFIGNYIQPYAYAALYGWTFALAALVCGMQYVAGRRGAWMFWAGICIGVTGACKPELVALSAGPTVAAWILASLAERRVLWRPLSLAIAPAVVIGAATYLPIVMTVPWHMLVTDTYEAFRQPQMVFFAHVMDGTLAWPYTGWAMVASLGMTLTGCGLAALLGLLLDSRAESLVRRAALVVWVCLIAGAGLWSLGAGVPALIDITPIRSAPLLLGAGMVFVIWRLWRAHARHEPMPQDDQAVLLLTVFSLIAIWRVVFNLSMWSPYTLFTAPTVIVLYCYLFFRLAPRWILPSPGARGYARAVAMVLAALALLRLGIQHGDLARMNDFAIETPRGRLLTDVVVGKAFDDAIRFAASRTRPGDYVLNLPQGTTINFLADRRHPLREEIIVPGFLTPAREADAIERVAAKNVKLILVSNHLTPEYRDWAFGVHYNQAFMRWIEAHYHPVATFTAWPDRVQQFGELNFFIRAYERNQD